MPELLLELFSEEIPARMQAQAAKDLERLVIGALAERGVTHEGARAYATPRRLALVVDGLPARQPDVKEERKGPRVNAPQAALDGFLRSTGLSKNQLTVHKDPKGDFYLAIIERKGRATSEVIAEIVPEAMRAFPWPKSMRWGAGSFAWVRPLHSILCVFDGKPVTFEIAGVKSGDTTRGNRLMANAEFKARNFKDYEGGLRKARVILDAEERKAIIRKQAQELAVKNGLEWTADEALLDEVAGLVEWPVTLMGSFDESYLSVPPEILSATMRANQKYFALHGKNGKLANKFLVVANLEAADGGKAIVSGNERVLAARLADAKFFWEQDLRTKLIDRLPALSGIVFHALLGSQRDRVYRLQGFAQFLAHKFGYDEDQAKRAADLSKCDLIAATVSEFPEVQGVIGRYLALNDKEKKPVADAIRDHYKPLGPSDVAPREPISVVVALADKLDALVGFFGKGEKPTGSKDPFALRRAALGIIRIILENNLRTHLREDIGWAAHLFPVTSPHEELLDFFADRLKVALRDKGVRHDLIDAVFALEGQDDLVLIVRRVEALQEFLKTEDGANLLAGYKRAANILKIEEKKDNIIYRGAPDAKLLKQDEERALHEALAAAKISAAKALEKEDFAAAMAALATLRAPVDRFFDKVTVNADDKGLRENRLRLLAQIVAAAHTVADFSKIEG